MKCPYLQGKYLQSCKASREVYIPSQFEFDEYCTHNGHKICPFYSKAVFATRVFTVTVESGNLISKTAGCGRLLFKTPIPPNHIKDNFEAMLR